MGIFKVFLGFFIAMISISASATPISTSATPLKPGRWLFELLRADSIPIVFNADLKFENNQPVLYIINASERMEVRNIRLNKDSVFIEMPFFESDFALQLQPDGSLKGQYNKRSTTYTVTMPVRATPNQPNRFKAGKPPVHQVSGQWEITFTRPDSTTRPAIGQFKQHGAKLTGSILTPSGDYRFLDGIVRGDSLLLSTFDGSHAYVFSAKISSNQQIEGGRFYSGPTHTEKFIAIKNDSAKLPLDGVGLFLKPDAPPLDFKFPDLNGKIVGIKDEQFKNKVVILQLMGSWCPNCMDETAFLSKYYDKHKNRGLEIISLAYEYSTDEARSIKSLRKFQQRFDVKYPMLLTGVTSSDTQRTEKTLPQLTPIKVFPSTIFVGRDGQIKKVHSGFFGPATGEAYTKYVKEFEETVNELLGN